jgi:predicted amidophosphoribosyltransferase
MRENRNSLKSDRRRKTLRDTSLTCDTNKFGSKKERLCLECGKKFLSIGPYNRLCEKCVSRAWKTF